MVARSALGKANAVNAVTSNINDSKHKNRNSNSMNNRFQTSQSSNLTGSLRDKLNKERQRLHTASSSRHSHFGGTLVVEREGGNDQIVSVTTASSAISPSKSGLLQCNRSTLSQVDAKRKTKKHQYFIGSGRPVMAYYSRPDAVHSSCTYTGPISHRAQCTLHSFCCTFLTNCYGPVMKSLKAEFRKESNRLEEEDKVIFFRIVWFFCQWWRVFTEEGGELPQNNVGLKKKDGSDTTSIGNLVFTMDMFTFNMVLSSLDFYLEHKKYKNIVQTVSLYTEMVRLIYSMSISSDSMENIMAIGLMDLLFYKQDCLDKLPKLLTRWAPGTYPIDYLCDLIELTHMTLKILEANEKACSNHAVSKAKKGKKGKQEEEEPQDRVSRMKEKAAEFDTTAYMARKIISNQVVFMFTQLLSQYSYNAPRINDHIVAFFVRLCKFVVPKDDDLDFSGMQDEKEDGVKSVTLEPMLFNIHLITVMNEILNDRNLRHDKDFRSVIGFGSTLVRHYARTCEKNPMLFVETLFRHSFPHRYCETLSNNYVSEELKMIAEREILLEQHAPDDDEEEKMVGNGLSDDEEEMEFEDEESIDVPRTKKTNLRANDDDQSDEEQEMEFDDDNIVSDKGSSDKDHEEEKVEYDDIREVTEAAPNKETDADDKWNDRRVFIPKRQRQDLAKDSTSEKTKEHEEDVIPKKNLTTSNKDEPKSGKGTPKRLLSQRNKAEISDEGESESEEITAPVVEPKPKRIKRTVIDDSSDEEEFGDTQITIPTQSGNKPIFDDSDDEN